MATFHDQVRNAIDPLRTVYETLRQNGVLRNRLHNAGISDTRQREIDHLMRSTDASTPDAYDPYELYLCIEGMLELARTLTNHVGPSLKSELSRSQSQMSSQNRMALQMTISNLDSNVRALVDRLSDLYIATSRLDEHQNGPARSVLRKHFPKLTDRRTWEVGSS